MGDFVETIGSFCGWVDALRTLWFPLIVIVVLASVFVVGLPKLRGTRWKSTLTSQVASVPEVAQPAPKKRLPLR